LALAIRCITNSRPQASFGNLLTLVPLADASIEHFVLDNLAYHGRNVTVVWDPQGVRWHTAGCKGLCVFLDGKVAATSPTLKRLEVPLDTPIVTTVTAGYPAPLSTKAL